MVVLEHRRYDGFGRLKSIHCNGRPIEYSYRPDGLRHGKTVDGVSTTHLWDGQDIVMELAGNGNVKARYVRGAGLIAQELDGQLYYYLHNAHGDVAQRTDAQGTILRNYDYDAFGNEAVRDKTDANPFRYCGEYYDAETEQVYLRNRYYEARNGRFTSEDVAKDGENWYSYCNGNPIAFVDPSGLSFWDDRKSEWNNAWQQSKTHWSKFGRDATMAWEYAKISQNQRWNELLENPSLLNFIDWQTWGGIVDAQQSRIKRAEGSGDVYEWTNLVLWGIPDTVTGAFNPDESYSFQHVMDSMGLALMVYGGYKFTTGAIQANNIKPTNSPINYYQGQTLYRTVRLPDGREIELMGRVDIHSDKIIAFRDCMAYNLDGTPIPNEAGHAVFRQQIMQYRTSARADGYETMIIQWQRSPGSTSANPGHIATHTYDLTRIRGRGR